MRRLFLALGRATEAELMDEAHAGGPELQEAYRHLRRLNRLFAASSPILYGLERLWRQSGRPQEMSILDIGAGSGDVNRAVLRWADRRRISLRIMLVDISLEACREAELLYRDESRVTVHHGDLYACPEGCADIVTATQFLHHIDTPELTRVVTQLMRLSRLGVVINDIHRHPVAWMAVWVAARLISRNCYIRHDGPLSVAKGFRAEDWQLMAQMLPAYDWHWSWRPLFRYAAVISRTEKQGGGRLWMRR